MDREQINKIYSDYLNDCESEHDMEQIFTLAYKAISSAQPKTGHCKDCKFYEHDSVAKLDRMPLIVAHEICNKWGGGCKTKEDGYCYLYEPQESEINNG